MNIESHELNEIQALYTQGLCLQAYERARQWGPLHEWRGAAARVLAGRLAANLGASRLQQWLHLHAWKNDRNDPLARYYYARTVLHRRGPLAAWKALRRFGDLPEATPSLRAEWLAFYGFVVGQLRDFDTAETYLARAQELDPDNPWICIERAGVLDAEDRYEESLASSQRSLELRPWYRPGVQAMAHTLQLLDRDDEALELLTEAVQRIESAPVAAQLAILQMELGAYDAVAESLERFVRLCPLMEKAEANWLAAVRSDVAYHQGDFRSAIEFAKQSDNPFFQKVVEYLEAATPEDRRVLLPIPFVRQHHMTCAPATLSAISRYWLLPADHLSVAEEICYDGTSNYSERHWAQEHGWNAREFTVTWNSARSLLDRGIAFTLATEQTASGHLQAVIGYDSRRGTFLIRDPYHHPLGEAMAKDLLEQQRATGPRGMILVPTDKTTLLDGIELPDAPFYDCFYQLNHCLQRHDRDGAQLAYEEIYAASPNHRLTLHARRTLAAYDADPSELLTCTDLLLGQFADNANLQLARLSCLRGLEHRDKRLSLLKEICEREGSDPLFWQQYAQELSDDAREYDTALHWLHRSLRVRPVEAGSLYILAGILWSQQQRDEALDLYRFAACVADREESFSRAYFIAARHFKQTETVLRFLESRFHRFGKRSSLPARTLFWALVQADRDVRAFEVLDKALGLRPEDGDLQLFAAEAHSRYGKLERATDLLETARGRAGRMAWLRMAATLAAQRGELKAALDLWQQVLQTEPLAIDAHQQVTQLLAQTDSPTAALTHFQEATTRFPHHYALHQLYVQWLREHDPSSAESASRHLVEIDLADDWARREIALILAEQRRFEDAFAEVDVAIRLRPHDSYNYSVRGQVCAMADQWEEAKAAFKEAIHLSVDNGFAITHLIHVGDSPAERRAALAFVESELARQTIFGDGLLAFRQQAQSTLNPEELLVALRKALDARPDLWHAWSAVIEQLVDLDRLDEAIELAWQSTQRFPLLPVMWQDLAQVHQARAEWNEERAALQQALRINPDYGPALRQLCSAYERVGHYDQSRSLLEAAMTRDPLNAHNHAWLADALWQMGDKAAAIESLEKALHLEPGIGWAWESLRDWAREQGCSPEAIELARDLTRRRSGEVRSWLVLARMLDAPEDLEERLNALDQAIALNPRCFEAYDLRAELLAEAGRFDEALAACHPPITEYVPSLLRGRMAAIEAQRGNMSEAITQMRGVLAEDPNYYWGWRQLVGWCRVTDAGEEYLEAARALAALTPQDPVAHGFLGHAKHQVGDPAGAKMEFQRAIELAPDYSFAGRALFDLQLEENDLEAASRTLEVLLEHVDDEWTLGRAVQLAIRRKDQNAAVERLRELCSRPASESQAQALAWATDAIQRAGWTDSAESVFREALDQPEVQPEVGRLWVKACIAREDWNCESRLPELLARGELGVFAMAAYVDELASANRRRPLRHFIDNNSETLRAHTLTWAETGHALLRSDDLSGCIQWLADWRECSDVEPWMLLSLVVALRHVNRDSEASEISQAALVLPEKAWTSAHALWLAVDEVLENNIDSASKRLVGIEPTELDPYYQFLYLLVQSMLDVQDVRQAPTNEHKAAFQSVRARLSQARSIYPRFHQDRLLQRIYRRCVQQIAGDVGVSWATLWGLWQSWAVAASVNTLTR